jgi:hypothetical protein
MLTTLGLLGVFFVIALWGGIVFLAAFVCALVFRWIYSPLAIPNIYPKLVARDRRILILGFMTMMYLGLPFLLITYLVGLFRHLRSQASPPPELFGIKEPCGIIPRFTMADMLAMVFSLGCSPAVFNVLKLFDREHPAILFAGAVITFPACFLPVLYRIQVHNVPSGITRMLLVALAPFVAFASALIIPVALVALFSGGGEGLIYLAVSIVALLAGRFLATKASDQARELANYKAIHPVL